MGYMFADCSSLTSLNLSNFLTLIILMKWVICSIIVLL